MTEEMAALLVCPLTRTKLRWDREAEELISDQAGIAYPIRDGVPVLLVEEGRRHDSDAGHGEGHMPKGSG